jgi:hypothetical protein
MILKSNGIKTDKFIIPPFVLNEGEIIVIYLWGGAHYQALKTFLKDIFCGITAHENVEIVKPLRFAEHFYEPKFRRIFYPITIGEYLRKHANPQNPYSTKIYDTNIHKKANVNQLQATTKKQLSIFSTLSHTNNIVFDLAGLDPNGANETYKIVKESVKNGGSAILIDWASDMKDDCTHYIELEWLIPFFQEKHEFKILHRLVKNV